MNPMLKIFLFLGWGPCCVGQMPSQCDHNHQEHVQSGEDMFDGAQGWEKLGTDISEADHSLPSAS